MCGEWMNVKENLAYSKTVNCVLLSYNIVKFYLKLDVDGRINLINVAFIGGFG